MSFERLISRVQRRMPRLRRRGSILLLLVLLLVMFTAIASLAVDYGHVQLVKSEMQRTADATARGYMEYYITNGQSYANTNGPALYSSANNPVDANSGVSPTVNVTWGYWTAGSSTFSTSSGTVPAVKVTVTRTSTGGNAVPLFWGGMMGFMSSDVHATAIAADMGGQTQSLTIPATACPYLAGMPNGTTNFGGDNTSNATPYQASIPVVPGTWITFTNLSGTTTVSPGAVPNTGPAGDPTYPVHHGQSWNNSPNSPGPENGVADAIMYEDATMGLFLTNNAPNLATAPAMVDWTQSSQSNQATYSNLAVQAPFLIGTGQTTGSVVKQFLVPPGATRLFIGVWDGYEYYNNSGSLTGTATVKNYVQLVQ
jgi:putative Tad-like protein involved in Flp pilus assembly